MTLTTDTRTLLQESQDEGGFYVPRFELRIAGVGLANDVLRDVIKLTYSDHIKKIDSVSLEVSNWDDDRFDFKYVGSEPADSSDALHKLFEPCNKEFELYMGYEGGLTLMMSGTFTSMEPYFPAAGKPTLGVRGLNVLHQLRRKQYTHAWTEMSESAIAHDVQGLRDPETRQKRFPLPIEVSSAALQDESPIDYLAQENQYDIDFLFALARRRGYEVAVRDFEGEKKLYFGPSDPTNPDTQITTYTLEWGKSLIDFTPTLTTANQIGSVTVNGWDRRRKKVIRETVTLDDRRLNRNEDLHSVITNCDAREDYVVNRPVSTKSEARKLAEGILRERQKDLIKAVGTTVGLPKLRAGMTIGIQGLGARFSGEYYVESSTHTIDDKGYRTKFTARREVPTGGGA